MESSCAFAIEKRLRYLSTLSLAVSSAFLSLHIIQARPPSNFERRKERIKPVSALAASPLAAMKDYREDVEIRLRIQVLAGERLQRDLTFHIKMQLMSGRGVS
jgi:hypothetical protein